MRTVSFVVLLLSHSLAPAIESDPFARERDDNTLPEINRVDTPFLVEWGDWFGDDLLSLSSIPEEETSDIEVGEEENPEQDAVGSQLPSNASAQECAVHGQGEYPCWPCQLLFRTTLDLQVHVLHRHLFTPPASPTSPSHEHKRARIEPVKNPAP